MSENSFNFYIHLAKYSDSQYHAAHHKNEYYSIFGNTSIAPKVKRALTFSTLTRSMYSDTIVLGGGGGNKTMSVMKFHVATLQ